MLFLAVYITNGPLTSLPAAGSRWYAMEQLFLSAILVYLYLKWVPHYYDRINHIRIATYFGECVR